MKSYFELKPCKNNEKARSDGEWYFNLIAANGKVVCTSQVYQRKQSALNGITAVKAAAIDAPTKITMQED